MSKIKDWTDCDLWKVLESRTGDHVQACVTTLFRIMPKIQAVIASGGTSPKDFTLHDAGHSFRVTQRMHELVVESLESLSAFEITLLIFSAYLHDVGMTPELKRVDAHRNYLLAGSKANLTENEVDDLQAWLDDAAYQLAPPISDSIPISKRLDIVCEILTYYCRHRHNEWGAAWVRENLKGEKLGNYDGWVEDLILLCQSHHFGGDRLRTQAFEPRWVGTPSVPVNIRFLSLALRVADILEFDPERTPDVILRHRDISPESLIHWWKDKGVSLKMGGGSIVISARPSSARIHRAIEEMVGAIDTELTLCRKIAEESPLGAMPGAPSPLPYKWSWPPVVHANIAPREDAYEYIDGAFRPDTKKLLSLLSGTSLYRTPLHAVRELTQNAFDAVRERIAYIRLSQPHPASANLASQLAEQHRVSLQLVTDGGDAFLVCTDNGIGMTKAIIRDRVLVSGSGPRHDVMNLDRLCKNAGFQLGRSGQFGIGILSYFMIATNVEIETLRAQEAPDPELTAWRFETEGVGSFGELRKLHAKSPGTQVRLRLAPEIGRDLVDWYQELRSYLVRNLVHCPCELHLSSPLPGCEPLALAPGWCPRDLDAAAFMELSARDEPREAKTLHLVSSAERDRRSAAKREMNELKQKLTSHLRWRSEEGKLSDGSAEYSIDIPYFALDEGASLAFLRSETGGNKEPIIYRFLNATHYRPKGNTEEAWRGMAVGHAGPHDVRIRRSGSRSFEGVFLRINWLSDDAGEINAGRDFFVGAKDQTGQWLEIRTHASNMIDKLLDESKDSQYSWLNERIAERSAANTSRPKWLRSEENQEAANGEIDQLRWSDVKFPSISRTSFGYLAPDRFQEKGRFILNGRPVFVVPWSVPAPAGDTEPRALGWNGANVPPDRIVQLHQGWRFGIAPIWLRRPATSSRRARLDSKFPPQWRELCGADFQWYAGKERGVIIWNRDHPLVKSADAQAWSWCHRTFQESIDPIPHREELLSDPQKSASWLLQCISRDSSEIWEGLPERDPKFLPQLWHLLFPGKHSKETLRAMFWLEDPGTNSRLRVVAPDHWGAITEDINRYLPAPSAGWKISRATEVPSGKSTQPFGDRA